MSKRYNKPLTVNELADRRDEDIDTSDIPELDEHFWANATISPPQNKPIVSLRLPEEVIQFFKTQHPKGFTSHMAAVLSAYVEAQRIK